MGLLLGELTFVIDVVSQLAERLFERLQRFEILLVRFILFKPANLGLERFIGVANLVHQAFDVADDGMAALLGVL